MNAQLVRAMIQRTHRGVTPPASITAPVPALIRDHTTEADRLATFDQSARTTGGKAAPFVAPAASAHPQSPLAAGAASDPFDHYHAEPLRPMTDAEGRQYEAEQGPCESITSYADRRGI